VDFLGKACDPDRDWRHANSEPKHQRSPPECGGSDNPDPKGDHASRDQICGEPFHARHLKPSGDLSFHRQPRSLGLGPYGFLAFAAALGSIAVNFMGEPQAVHCGPWFCLSSMAFASVRRSEFTGKPTGRLRFEGIRCNDSYLNLIALRTFEQAMFETNWPRRNAFQHHPRLAAGTARALDSGQELLG
jgi:hypothetical protein